MAICPFSMLPDDVLKVVCSNLKVWQLGRFGQTSTALNKLCTGFAEYFAKDEQRRLGIPFQGIPLTMRRLIEHWGNLPTETCKKIWDAIRSRPIIFYGLNFVRTASSMIRPGLIGARELFKDEFSDDHARQITEMVCKYEPNNVEKQFILACYTGDSSFVMEFLQQHQFTKKFSLETALEILCYTTTSDRCKFMVIPKVTWEQAREIANSISDPLCKAAALLTVACNIPVDVAQRITDSLDEVNKASMLSNLLPTEQFKKAFEIANRIPLEPGKSNTLFDLALKAFHELSWKDAFKIALTIPDPNKRSEALSRISLEMPRELKKKP